MCADSLPKINSSSLFVMSKGNIKSFNDSKHARNAFSRFVQFYKDGTLADCVLSSCDNKKFNVHSLILTASSEYFSNIFRNVEKSYHLDFVESTVLDKIIQFCYTGEIDLSSNNIQAITFAANELAMKRLKKVCNQYLESATDTENFLLYAIIAEKCGLKSSQELAQKYLMFSCNKICETNDVTQLNTHRLSETVTNLCSNQGQIFGGLIQSLNNNGGESNALLLNSYQAIYQLFFMAGYIQSLVNVPIQEKPPSLVRSGTIDIPKVDVSTIAIPKVDNITPIESEINDEGLFFVAKNKLDGVDIYATVEINGVLRIMPKHHIFVEKMNLDTLKVFSNREKLYLSYIKEQRLVIKSWNFKRQNSIEVILPTTVQFLKPRLTNAVGDRFFVTEEKYITRPYEGYKTTICLFGLDTEKYQCIETNCGGIKEIIGIGDEIFVFNQKAEVFSFNVNQAGKRFPRGALSRNGAIKAIVYHGTIYVACYVRCKCTVYIEKFNMKTNQWTMIRSICSYTDASNYHVGATENFLYIFCGKGKVQRYNDVSDQWSDFTFPEHFNPTVLCVSTSPFTCMLHKL